MRGTVRSRVTCIGRGIMAVMKLLHGRKINNVKRRGGRGGGGGGRSQQRRRTSEGRKNSTGNHMLSTFTVFGSKMGGSARAHAPNHRAAIVCLLRTPKRAIFIQSRTAPERPPSSKNKIESNRTEIACEKSKKRNAEE